MNKRNATVNKSWKAGNGLAIQLGLLVCAVIIGLAQPAWAQAQDSENKKPKPKKLFASDGVMEITITAPWSTLKKNRKIEDPYSATIAFTDSLGESHQLPLTVERRGLTRQTVCKFPPIKLRFDKATVKGSVFRGQKSLKLVTHCENGRRAEQYYVKEMLTYRMYNQITDLSFKVRQLTVSYVDSDDGDTDTHFGFFIEDDSDVAKRNELKKLDRTRVNHTLLDSRQMARFSMFQYMIANVDWSALKGPGTAKCCHNARLIGDESSKLIYAIPYDFDSSGLVDAHYAAPNPSLPINKVTQRLFRGYCFNNPHMESVRQEYLAQEQAILDLVRNEPLLTKSTVKSTLRYLDDFFETLKSDKKFDKNIMAKCRK